MSDRPVSPMEKAAEALVEGARENGLQIVPWAEMAEGPKEANRVEARTAVLAFLSAAAEDDETVEAMARAMRDAEPTGYTTFVKVILRALAARQREVSDG